MKRKYDLYIKDIIGAINDIEEYVEGYSYEDLVDDNKTVDAVIRKLEIIGEASGQLPEEFRKEHEDIPWNKIRGFRNVVVHKYWAIDKPILWDIIQNKLQPLKDSINRIR